MLPKALAQVWCILDKTPYELQSLKKKGEEGAILGTWLWLDETNHDMVKVRLISAGLVSAFLIHSLFF